MNNPYELSSLKLHKLYTEAFWEEFRSLPFGRRGVSRKSKARTIAAIQRLGEVRLYFSANARTPKDNRAQYEHKSKKLKKFTGFKYCFACGGSAEVRHHLIWIKHGGRNTRYNIVALCRACHAEIHPWLKG